MGRRAALLILALTLNPATLRAQEAVLTVTAQSADIYKGPSNVTPVIGHVARGTVRTHEPAVLDHPEPGDLGLDHVSVAGEHG